MLTVAVLVLGEPCRWRHRKQLRISVLSYQGIVLGWCVVEGNARVGRDRSHDNAANGVMGEEFGR